MKRFFLPLAFCASLCVLFFSCGTNSRPQNSSHKKNSESLPPVQSAEEHILALEAKNIALEESQKKFFNYFVWLFGTIVAGTGILLALNIRQNKRKDKQILNSEQFLRYSIEGQEAERKRISQELHDSIAQNMRYVLLLAENLGDKDAAKKIIEAQNQNIESVRRLCYNLTPPSIEAGDMIQSLALLGQKIFDAPKSGFDFRVVCEPCVDFGAWNATQLMNIYRIVQEALQNIQKHAKAGEATVFFKRGQGGENVGKTLKIIITDDGCGMEPSLARQINAGVFDTAQDMRFGLRNIFERASFLGGRVECFSDLGAGTRIVVEI
ncbi:MAG: hypothetical protein IK015_00855 [Treponema sp.]|nr:hypothetical protein [Treponema sp.]